MGDFILRTCSPNHTINYFIFNDEETPFMKQIIIIFEVVLIIVASLYS